MYKVRLQQFEGPLDLLLFFIRRDELDIHDIPIASIADEFLEYITFMKEVDLDGVGDFLYMAAVLISIKAKMLLPSSEVGDDGELLDPRQELAERLMEYIRFKEATETLSNKYDERSLRFDRGAASSATDELSKGEEELVEATVIDLILALKRVLTDAPDEVFHEVEAETYTLQQQREYLKEELHVGERRSFVELVMGNSKQFIITTFLSILEMARLQELDIFIGHEPSDFFVQLTGIVAELEENFEGKGQSE